MKRIFPPLSLVIITFFFVGCTAPQQARLAMPTSTDDGLIDITILQINDVYEIAPLEGGKIGGMARVATLRKKLLSENKNTYTVHAGDFLNPSLIGTLKYEGERIAGKQMVELMNAIGVDLATFGNHEFDLKEEDLQKRLNESEFAWTSANVLQNVCGNYYPFYQERDGEKQFIPETYILETSDADGTKIKIGIFSVTLPANPIDYVFYQDATTEALKAYKSLVTQTDLVLGLTHQSIDEDMAMAKLLPGVPLIMGGHEHDNMMEKVGNTVVTKADANAKSAYVHHIHFDQKTKKANITSDLVMMDQSIAIDTEIDPMVSKWNKILLDKMGEIVDEPLKVIYVANPPLDGRESTIRNGPTNLGDAITKAMLMFSKEGAECALQNSGSIRIDDQIRGDVTAVDVFRALPFGGPIFDVEMTGGLMQEVLDFGESKKGTGAYLQKGNITFDEDKNLWLVNDKSLDVNKVYKVALNDFLLTGLDIPFLTAEHPGIIAVHKPVKGSDDPRLDVRVALINYLKSL